MEGERVGVGAEQSIWVRSPCYCCWLGLGYRYVLCRRHGDELPLEVERLWATLAVNRRNIIPLLDFLVSLGCHMACQVCWTCVMVPRSFALTPCPCDPWSCLSCSCTRAHCERSSMPVTFTHLTLPLNSDVSVLLRPGQHQTKLNTYHPSRS